MAYVPLVLSMHDYLVHIRRVCDLAMGTQCARRLPLKLNSDIRRLGAAFVSASRRELGEGDGEEECQVKDDERSFGLGARETDNEALEKA